MQASRLLCWGFLLVLAVCWVGPALHAQTSTANTDQSAAANTDTRIADLEKEIEALRTEVAALKQAKDSASAPPATSNNLVAGATPSAAPSSAPTDALAGITSVLHGATLNGLVDVYYGYNANQSATRSSQLRAFDGPTNQFALNLIELTLDKQPDPNNSRLGYRFALGFGQAMNVVNGTDPGGQGFAQYLKEAYFSYLAPVGKGLQVDVGKFVTPHGFEVIESNANWNYSRGLLFTYAIPFYHFGMRAKYTLNSKYSLTGYVVNGWNDVVDNNSGKTLGLTFGWNPTKKWALTQNYMAGPEMPNTTAHWRQLTDTVLSYSPTSKLSLAGNVDYGRGDFLTALNQTAFWTGFAGYVRYAFNPRYAITTRYEYFDDHNGFTTGTAQHIDEFTGTLERRIAQHLLTRLELRHDLSNRPAFLRGDTPVAGQTTVTGGLVFVLEPSETSASQ